jgi:hypothetical protein
MNQEREKIMPLENIGIRALEERQAAEAVRLENIGAARQFRTPDFVILGAAKCGTTTLFEYLCRHPRIFTPPQKEPQFFADQFKHGWDWYRSLYADAADKLCGDASTIYTWWQKYPLCAARLGRHLPNAKLIYIMRHPVERTFSDYGEQLKTARALNLPLDKLATFERFIEAYDHLVRAGEYIHFIDEYRRHYPPDAFLFLLLDDLQRDPASVLRRVCRHLDIEEDADLVAQQPIRANQAAAYYQWQTRLTLSAPLRKVPGLSRLLGAVTTPKWREKLYALAEATPFGRAARKRFVPPPMRPETRRALLDRFREPTRRLAEFLNRDLSHWNQ